MRRATILTLQLLREIQEKVQTRILNNRWWGAVHNCFSWIWWIRSTYSPEVKDKVCRSWKHFWEVWKLLQTKTKDANYFLCGVSRTFIHMLSLVFFFYNTFSVISTLRQENRHQRIKRIPYLRHIFLKATGGEDSELSKFLSEEEFISFKLHCRSS